MPPFSAPHADLASACLPLIELIVYRSVCLFPFYMIFAPPCRAAPPPPAAARIDAARSRPASTLPKDTHGKMRVRHSPPALFYRAIFMRLYFHLLQMPFFAAPIFFAADFAFCYFSPCRDAMNFIARFDACLHFFFFFF